MKITFDPSNYALTGVCSFASWESADLKEAIRRAFHESEREEIVEIVIDKRGVTARFEVRCGVTR